MPSWRKQGGANRTTNGQNVSALYFTNDISGSSSHLEVNKLVLSKLMLNKQSPNDNEIMIYSGEMLQWKPKNSLFVGDEVTADCFRSKGTNGFTAEGIGGFTTTDGSFSTDEGNFTITNGDFTTEKGDFKTDVGHFTTNDGYFTTNKGSFTVQTAHKHEGNGGGDAVHHDTNPDWHNAFYAKVGSFHTDDGDFVTANGRFHSQHGSYGFGPDGDSHWVGHSGINANQVGDVFKTKYGNFKTDVGNFKTDNGNFETLSGQVRIGAVGTDSLRQIPLYINRVVYTLGGSASPYYSFSELNNVLDLVVTPLAGIQFSAFMKGNILCEGIFVQSDSRIKNNIVEVDDNLALDMVREIECKYYNYKDPLSKSFGKTIGFIAQQVKEILPMAVTIVPDFIPNEMRLCNSCIWSELESGFKLTIPDLDNSDNTSYKFILSNAGETKEIIEHLEPTNYDSKSFVLDKKYDNVFIYGKLVDDFHVLNKEKIFTLHHVAIQSLDTELIKTREKNNELENKLNALEDRIRKIEERLT